MRIANVSYRIVKTGVVMEAVLTIHAPSGWIGFGIASAPIAKYAELEQECIETAADILGRRGEEYDTIEIEQDKS